MEKEESKNRATSSTSSTSVTEFVNEIYDGEDGENFSTDMEKGIKGAKNLQDFTEMPTITGDTSELIPTGFRKMYLAALVVLSFAICMGVTATYSATATADMKKPHSSIHPTTDEISWIGSLMAVGALAGGTAGGYFTSALGRKGSLILNSLPFIAGWILIAFAQNTAMIYCGRLITGFSTGIVSVATPMYLVEISTSDVRGLLGASFQLFVVIGVLLISSLGAGLTWQWLAISGAVACLLAGALMLTMPESPRWLMTKNRREEAQKALIYLQGKSFDAEAECQALEDEINRQPAGGVQLKEFLVPTVYKPFILSILLMFFQQFSGVNAVLFYTVDIFRAAHVTLNPVVCTIIVAIVQVLATLLGSLLMDKAGRKILLVISALCMAISLLAFGGYDFAKVGDPDVIEKYGWVPVVCLTFFIAAFSIGYGPAPWLMVAEMTSVRIRGVVSGISTALNWTFAFIITYTFKKLVEDIHGYGVYWLYSAFCLLSIIMTVFFLPETKGKTSEEIEQFFSKK